VRRLATQSRKWASSSRCGVLTEQGSDFAVVEVAQGEGIRLDVEGAPASLSLRIVANRGFVVAHIAHSDECDAADRLIVSPQAAMKSSKRRARRPAPQAWSCLHTELHGRGVALVILPAPLAGHPRRPSSVVN